MRMVSALFPGIVEIDEHSVTGFIIENKALYRKVASEIYRQCNGEAGEIIISEDDEILKIASTVELITDFIGFEPDNKKFATRVMHLIENELQQGEKYYKAMEVLSDIERLMNEATEMFPFRLSFEGINFNAMIKMASPKIIDDSASDIEHIYDYMEIIRELLGERLFIFVGLRDFFDKDELQDFIDTVVSHKYKVLLLDSYEYDKLNNERRLLIDNDICCI